jgi:hypothetical protein
MIIELQRNTLRSTLANLEKQSHSQESLKRLLPCVRKCVWLFFTMISIVVLNSPAHSQTSISGQQDIAVLMKIANKTYDMDNQDALILFDGYRVHWTENNIQTKFVHRITWINRSVAISHYADIPVEYDSERQSFRLMTLRTWRDGQWWESDTAGVVETLPSAVRTAYDYADTREMMLLHIGIELPCILEEAYIVQDIVPFRKGVEGTFTFSKQDPVIQSWFMLGIPQDRTPNVFLSEGVKMYESEYESQWGLDIYKYELELIPSLTLPSTKDANFYSPHISWSSWENWDDFGKDLNNKFESGNVLDSALIDSVEYIVDNSYTSTDRAKKIAEFVKRSTRLINVDESRWAWLPRTAIETYHSGYGHHFDRAIFAAALFKEAGYMVFPVFRSKEYGDVNEGIPTLARFEGMSVWISEMNGVEAYYNAATSRVHNGLAPIYGRTIWLPGSGDDPKVNWSGEGAQSEVDVKLDLSFDEESSTWKGTGFYRVTNGFNAFDELEGVGSETRDHLTKVLKGVFSNAKIIDYNFAVFNRFLITAGFEFELDLEKDDQGRLELNFGGPGGGIIDKISADVKLSANHRGSPITLLGMMKESTQIRLSLPDYQTVYIPENVDISNDVGSLKINSTQEGEDLTIVKVLTLSQSNITGDDWSQLRELLLGHSSKKNSTLIVKNGGE